MSKKKILKPNHFSNEKEFNKQNLTCPAANTETVNQGQRSAFAVQLSMITSTDGLNLLSDVQVAQYFTERAMAWSDQGSQLQPAVTYSWAELLALGKQAALKYDFVSCHRPPTVSAKIHSSKYSVVIIFFRLSFFT